MKKQIVIVGAGPAGITAGYELVKHHSDKYDVTIVEKDNIVGGISRTVNHNGNRMDIGGHRFFSKSKQVNDWWKEILPHQNAPAYDDIVLKREVHGDSDGADPEKTDNVFLTRRRVSRIYYKNKFFDYPVKLNLKTLNCMGAELPSVLLSYMKSMLLPREENSLEDFYINRFGKKLYSMFFESYTEKLWGIHPSRLSADWGSQRVKGLSCFEILKNAISKSSKETSLIEEFYYPKFGPGQMWETAIKKFEEYGGRVLMNTEVVSLQKNCENNTITKVIVKKDNNEICLDADVVISSMPLVDLAIALDAPKHINAITDALPYRDFVSVGLLVDKLALKNTTDYKTLNDIIPDCWIYVQNNSVKVGRVQIYNNWSPYMVKSPQNTVWVGMEYFCTENDSFWRMSEWEWMNLAKQELAKIGLVDDKAKFLDYHIEKMPKAYPAYYGAYRNIDVVKDYLNTISNLYCVGRNGQHRYNNLDHSMITAFETVKNIVNGIEDKSNIWQVNTEKNYHETK